MKLVRAGLKPSAFPQGMIIGIVADDPRVQWVFMRAHLSRRETYAGVDMHLGDQFFSFPPRKMKPILDTIKASVVEPKADVARSYLFWDTQVRKLRPRFKKSHIDKRREEVSNLLIA